MWKQLSATLAIFLGLTTASPAKAFIPIATEAEDGTITLEMLDASISDLPAFRQGGTFKASSQVIEFLGYNPSRTWYAGDRPEEIMKVGDLQYYGFENLSIAKIYALQGITLNPQTIPLNQLGVLEDLTIEDLTKIIPGLKRIKIKSIKPLNDLLGRRFRHRRVGDVLNQDPDYLYRQQQDELIAKIQQTAKTQLGTIEQETKAFITENITTVESNLNLYISEYLPEVDSRLLLGSVNAELKQKLDGAIATQKEQLEQKLVNFIADSKGLERLEIDRYIRQEIKLFQVNIDSLTNEAISDTKNTVKTKLETVAEPLYQSQLNNFIEENYNSLYTSVNSQIDLLSQNTETEIASIVETEIGNISGDINFGNIGKIGNIKLSNYDLSEYTAADIPNITNTKISRFPRYENLNISDIPGIASLNFNQYPNLPNFGTGIARIDLVFSEAEGYAERAISGSDREGFNTATCRTDNNLNGGCAHIELGGPLPFNRGKQWVTGDSQKVKGGHGMLRWVNGGKEPTGRMPFPEASFKMVLRNSNEQTDEVELMLAFRYGFYDWFGNPHFTPYGIFEIPFFTTAVRDILFLGTP